MQKVFFLLLLALVQPGSYRTIAQTLAARESFLLNVRAIGADRAAMRATRNFWEQVGDKKQERWYKSPEGYLARYSDSAIQAQYRYDRDGKWVCAILTYSEKEMPKEVRRLVLSTYFDYKIGLVQEVRQGDLTSYVVHIEDPTSWKDLIVADGDVTVWHEYDK